MNAQAKAETYRIVSFIAENIKRIKTVAIAPDGNIVELTGDNGNGKTSILDAIWWAIEDATHIQDMPIREGAEEAFIKLDLGKYKVTRKFRAKDNGAYTTSITVATEEGAKYDKPQDLLNALVGALAFDPIAFTRMKPVEQLHALRDFVPDVDFDAIDKAIEDDSKARTDINRTLKTQKTLLDAAVIPTDAPTERIDETALIADLEQAGTHNTDIERQRSSRDETARRIETIRGEVSNYTAKAADLRAQAEELLKLAGLKDDEAEKLQTAFDALPALPTPIDTSDVRSRIEAARESNARFDSAQRAREEKTRLAAEVSALEVKSAGLTKTIDDRKAAKSKAVSEAKMPVAGISFGDDVVLLNGVPFDQASDAEQLLTSVAIAAAQNPKLRVMRIRDGSLIGRKNWALLTSWAAENDFQIWIETVESSRPTAIVIEDGMVRGAAQQAAE